MNSLLKKHLKNWKILTKFYQDERWFICWFGGGGDMGRGGRAAPWTGFSIRKTGFLKLRFSEGFFRYTVLETHFLVIM